MSNLGHLRAARVIDGDDVGVDTRRECAPRARSSRAHKGARAPNGRYVCVSVSGRSVNE